MNFSTKTKCEIIKHEQTKKCCKTALLSAFLRTAGSLETKGGVLGFSAVSDAKILQYIAKIIFAVYGENAKIVQENQTEQRSVLSLHSKNSINILTDTKIVSVDENGLSLHMDIDEKLIENQCCKTAFIIGAFLGSGTVTVPNSEKQSRTSYHLEFVFSKKVIAEQFCHLFSEFGFMPKMIERKETYVCYLKHAESINDVLTLLGAINSSLQMTDIIMERELKNAINRQCNCDMHNMDKAVLAAFECKRYIDIIDQTIGLGSLPEGLREVALARQNSDASLATLAEELNISKSCLSHRLRKIKQIATDLDG